MTKAATTKGRKALPTATQEGPEFHPNTLPEDAQTLEIMAHAKASYSDERDLVNQLLGQAQMAGAFEEFSRTVRTSKLAYVKENKLYRAIAGKIAPHGAEELAGTWEEFCGLLGRSVDQIDRDIANLRSFGEEALESMSRMGIGYRELRQYRKLPEDKRLALIEVAKSGDKDSLLDLAEDFIAENTKKTDELAARVSDLEGTVQATERLLTERTRKLDELTVKKGRVKTEAPDDVLAGLRHELAGFVTSAEHELAGKVLPAMRAIIDHHAIHGGESTDFLEGAMRQVERMATTVRLECGLGEL